MNHEVLIKSLSDPRFEMYRICVVKQQARISRKSYRKFSFTATDDFILDGQLTSLEIGRLDHEARDIAYGPAIKIKDWIFVIEVQNRIGSLSRSRERSDPPAESEWTICGFYQDDHFVFETCPKDIPALRFLVEYSIPHFLPMLGSEYMMDYLMSDKRTEPFRFEWKTHSRY